MLRLPDDENLNEASDSDYDPIAGADDQIFSDEQSPDYSFSGPGKSDRRSNLIAQAKNNIQQGKKLAGKTASNKIGEALGNKDMFAGDSREDVDQAKALARKKARGYAKDKIAGKIGDKAMATGFKKGLSKDAGKLASGAAKKAIGKAAGKVGAQAATKGVQAGVTAAGAGAGVATFGLGFLLSILLNIAISLGVNDAVEAGFELKAGNVKQAVFLATRAAAKVGMFIYLLITLATVVSIGGMILGIPLLLFLNIYMFAGFAFKKIPMLQGLVWWEIGIVIFVDIMAFLIIITFIAGIGWYLCSESGLGGGGVSGAIAGAVVSVYDWWEKSTAGSVAADFCKYTNNATP